MSAAAPDLRPRYEEMGLHWMFEGVRAAGRGDIHLSMCYRNRAAGAELVLDWDTEERLFLAFVVASIDAAQDHFLH